MTKKCTLMFCLLSFQAAKGFMVADVEEIEDHGPVQQLGRTEEFPNVNPRPLVLTVDKDGKPHGRKTNTAAAGLPAGGAIAPVAAAAGLPAGEPSKLYVLCHSSLGRIG